MQAVVDRLLGVLLPVAVGEGNVTSAGDDRHKAAGGALTLEAVEGYHLHRTTTTK